MQRSGQSGPKTSLSRTSSGRGRPRSSASQRSVARAAPVSEHRNRTSIRPPVARWKKLRAGNTRVSLRTSTSPARRSAGRSEKTRSSSGACIAPRDEQPRSVARLDRRLGDKPLRQLVVEIGQSEPAPTVTPPPGGAQGARARLSTCSPHTHSTAAGTAPAAALRVAVAEPVAHVEVHEVDAVRLSRGLSCPHDEIVSLVRAHRERRREPVEPQRPRGDGGGVQSASRGTPRTSRRARRTSGSRARPPSPRPHSLPRAGSARGPPRGWSAACSRADAPVPHPAGCWDSRTRPRARRHARARQARRRSSRGRSRRGGARRSSREYSVRVRGGRPTERGPVRPFTARRTACRRASGGVRPQWMKPLRVSTRPREVRWSRPFCTSRTARTLPRSCWVLADRGGDRVESHGAAVEHLA